MAQLVEAVSETKAANGVELPWEQRKAEKLARLRADGPDVAALKAADAIHNARAIIADHGQIGAQIWSRFKRGPDQTVGYYRSILEVVRAKLADHPIALELAAAVEELAAAAEYTWAGIVPRFVMLSRSETSLEISRSKELLRFGCGLARDEKTSGISTALC